MIDQKTINREYPVPHPDNMLEEDVTRIKDSFEKIDIDVNGLYGTTTQFSEDAQSGTYWFGDSMGTGAAYLINLVPSPTALVKGMFIHMKAHVKNSGPATVDVNSLGVKNIKKIDGSDLKQGDIPENGVITLVYDGTNFQLANSAMDKEQTGVNTSNIMRAFEEIQENHGGALLMEAGWSDSFSNPDEQGADETNSSGFQHDNTSKLYKGTDPGLGLTSDKNYDTESNFLQQEWTNANQATSQATIADGSVTLDQDTASTGEHINWWRSGEIFQAQSLTPSAGVFHSFKVNLRSVGSPTHVLVGKIYAESGDQKTGSALYTSGNYNASSLTGTFQEVEFIFTGFTPDGATKYVFSVEGDDVGDASNYIQIEGIVGSATFAGGANSYDNTLSTRDLQMKTYFIPDSTATISSGIWPTNCENGRISFDSGSTWFDIISRNSDTQIAHKYTTSGTSDYIIRMSEFSSGEVKLNKAVDSNILLLLHAEGSDASTIITDSSNTSHSPVVVGNAQIDTSQKKFGSSSIKFDGNGDYITVPDHSDWDFQTSGTGTDFTIECWVRFNTLKSSYFYGHGNASSDFIIFKWNTNNTFTFTCNIDLAEQVNFIRSWTPSTGVWYHIALIRGWGGNADDWAITVDGSQVGATHTDSGRAPTSPDGDLIIGAAPYILGSTTHHFDGWIDEYRISNIARWTTNFTPSNEPYIPLSNTANIYVSSCDTENQKTNTSGWTDINSGSVTETLNSQDAYYWLTFDPAASFGTNTEVKIFNQAGSLWRTIAKNNGSHWEYNNAVHDTTKLLIHGDGADASTTITDSGPSGYAFTSYGNAQIDTAQSKFGGSSLLFDGTGDYILSDSASDDFSFGASDFTIDFWIKYNVLTGGATIIGAGDSGNDSWDLFNASGSVYQITYAHPSHSNFSFHFTRESTAITGQWYHLALVREGQIYRWFEDGVLQKTSDTLGDADCGVHSGSKLILGARPNATPSTSYLNGWLDEVRFSKSALWTSDFTPPTGAHTYVSGAASDYTGVEADTDDVLHAVSQAVSAQPANRMKGAQLADITDAEWEASGGWSTSTNNIVRGVTLYSKNSSQNPSVSQYSLNYDSERNAMDLRSKAYDPGFVPVEGYVWSQIEHSDIDGPGTFYVTRNGGTEWTTVPMTQQGLPLSGDIRIYRGTVDVSGQISGQDFRCRHQTESGKDQFLQSWGLQAKS